MAIAKFISIRFADESDTEPPSSIREAEQLGDLHATLSELIASYGADEFREMAKVALDDARDTITPAGALADFDDDIAAAIGRTAIEDDETRGLLNELQIYRRSAATATTEACP